MIRMMGHMVPEINSQSVEQQGGERGEEISFRGAIMKAISGAGNDFSGQRMVNK